MKRDFENRMIAGVCAGLGKSMNLDPTIVRLLFVLAVLGGFGIGVIIYVLLWILMPKD